VSGECQQPREERFPQSEELHLSPESVEALARRLAELLTPSSQRPERPRNRLISAEEVSRWWGVGRRWVYDHADELGARRLGSGQRPRLRFDPEEVAERLDELTGAQGGRHARRLHGNDRDCRTDSLSTHGRAMVGRQAKKRPGRRGNAPRPGADVGGARERLSAESLRVARLAPTLEEEEAGGGH
jgi:hypothetical protein